MLTLLNQFVIKTLFERFVKFGLVGFSGMLIDFGITYITKEKLGWQKYISNATGFLLAASSNYLLNRIWTFRSVNPAILIEYSEFVLIAIIGLAINTLILWILVSKLNLKFYFSKLMAIAVVMVWNFGANLLITFR
ncbi:MAG: GtrA family protein [Bacteroidales bacterium]|nr:GtrA family protein [Bacteroidales bacterium]MDD3700668.1 GtrA family protein [Bacteroidales bacterium]